MSYQKLTPREEYVENLPQNNPMPMHAQSYATLGFLGGAATTPLLLKLAPRKFTRAFHNVGLKLMLGATLGAAGTGIGSTFSFYKDRDKFKRDKFIYDTEGRAYLKKTAGIFNTVKTNFDTPGAFYSDITKKMFFGGAALAGGAVISNEVLNKSDMDPWKKRAISTGIGTALAGAAVYGAGKLTRSAKAFSKGWERTSDAKWKAKWKADDDAWNKQRESWRQSWEDFNRQQNSRNYDYGRQSKNNYNYGRQSRPFTSQTDTILTNLNLKNKDGHLYKPDGTPITTKEDFKNYYKTLVKQNHPDMGGSHDKMSKINDARDKFMKSVEFEKLAAFLSEKQKDKVKKTGVVAAGLGTTALGLSLAPAAASFSRAAFAAKRAKETGSFAKALMSGSDGAQVVGNYLEGAERFGRSPLGRAFGAILRNTKKVQEKVDTNSAGPVSKLLHTLYSKAGLNGNSFSNLHYSKFTQSKNVKDAANFWLDVESFGVPKGRYEHAAKEFVKENIGTVPKGMDPASFVDSLINAKAVSPEQLAKQYDVPSFKDSSTVSESLKDLYKRKTQDKAITDAFKEGIEARVGIDKSNKAYINAVKDMGLNGTAKERKAVGKMALEKSLAGYPAGYAKATVGGTVGLSTAGVGITYSGLKKDKK